MIRIVLPVMVTLAAIATGALGAGVVCKPTDRSVTLCDKLNQQINRDLKTQSRPDTRTQLRIIADAIGRDPRAWGATSFALPDGGGLANNYCCSCVPGEDCSAEHVEDVCSPAPAGADTCPAGEFRAVCTGNFCSGID